MPIAVLQQIGALMLLIRRLKQQSGVNAKWPRWGRLRGGTALKKSARPNWSDVIERQPVISGEEIWDTKQLVRAGVLEAPVLFMEEQNERLRRICNGCGAAGAKFDFVPDTVWGLCICAACHIHDYEYNAGSTEEDRRRADERFLLNGMRLIETGSNWFTAILRRRRFLKYYTAVREFGEDAFWAGKEVPG